MFFSLALGPLASPARLHLHIYIYICLSIHTCSLASPAHDAPGSPGRFCMQTLNQTATTRWHVQLLS